MEHVLICGNSLEILKKFHTNTIDSIVTDPPYGLTDGKSKKGFMGNEWDGSGIEYSVEFWSQCLRILKPGGFLIAFSGSRTYHRMAVAIEDAGFDIKDQLLWLYSQGFPKGQDIGKQIDKRLGAEREVVGYKDLPSGLQRGNILPYSPEKEQYQSAITAPATELAKKWDGWNTQLKPAHEPMVLARKPLSEKTITDNVLKWGVGALNIGACRIGTSGGTRKEKDKEKCSTFNTVGGYLNSTRGELVDGLGKYPTNLMHDGLEEEWSKYFYCAKPSTTERNEGLDGFEAKQKVFNGKNSASSDSYVGGSVEDKFSTSPQPNTHPTIKPIDLMAYLVRLVCPKDGIVLDPFNGSGSTGKACAREDINYIGIDLSQEFINISEARIQFEKDKKKQN